ncbi:hypothetical protein [Streptomyces broussonetiae]|uniref:hypothetical protein n=1 Tax=Streptomyces broussonetiae TaxID=2686304 RepID=UPI002D7FD2D8|nr:hypothetical protein [Streptomyces broussonetiae]
MRSLLEQGVDGVMLSEPLDEGSLAVAADVLVPVLGAPPGSVGPCAVTADGGAALARAATEHLLELDHTTVHHLLGPQWRFVARGRPDGWRTALAERGVPQQPAVESGWSAASGYTAGRALPEQPELTAVFAAGDMAPA